MSTEMYQIPKKLSNYDISCNAVGIDFGTTECCAAVIRKNGPELVVLDPTTRTRTMPSFIAYDETNPKCGQIVINRMWYKAEHTVYDIKRILGRNLDDIIVDPIWPFRVIQRKGKGTFIQVETYNKGKLKIESEKIAGTLLGYIKNMIEEFENRTLTDVVISVPSEISESQKAATKMAAEYSGWKNIHFIPEPVAAAFAYFNEMEIPNNSNILICDFGGGTVDICIAKVVGDNLKVLTFCGDSYLGGRDFDRLLFDHFASILTNKHGINLAKKNYILKPKCQVIKHDLSVATEIALNVGDFHPERDEIITITRDEFETMSMNLIIRTKNVILQAILKANLLKQDIDFVFQVGGGCRMPMIKKLLADIFPKANHQCSIHPDEIVAHGAALYAYYIKTCMLEQNDKLMQNLGDLMQQ
uniref:Uncharacterized protein n=1 Tax=Panagrolaimus sp. PS1159 TaxID=55785 RepID=A0AC35GAB3_9BILA